MKKIEFFVIIFAVIIVAGYIYIRFTKKTAVNPLNPAKITQPQNSLSISAMRARSYPGSDIKIEQTSTDGANYHQYIASYLSDGLKIYGLLTVPAGQRPVPGWPAIIFNHGYIPPEQYRTTERYIAYVDAFARAGYVVFKPDYRGNGNSEGLPEGAYYSPAYAIDDLNAIASIKRLNNGERLVDTSRIGVWGHSMGGNITLRDLVINTKDIKAAVIWGGVVGSYFDLMNNWQRRVPFRPSVRELALRNRYRQDLIGKYGTPDANPDFWNSIDPTYFIADITAPIQFDNGAADEEVPVSFAQNLYNKLKQAGKTVEFYTYPGADHNISGPAFNLAISRSVEFFDKYLK